MMLQLFYLDRYIYENIAFNAPSVQVINNVSEPTRMVNLMNTSHTASA